MSNHDIDNDTRAMLDDAIERYSESSVKTWRPTTELIVSDIKRGGPISRALQDAFGLIRQGA